MAQRVGGLVALVMGMVALTVAGVARAALWDREPVPVAGKNLNGVTAINRERAWAVGEGGLVLERSADGWQSVVVLIQPPLPPIIQDEWDFHAVDFVDDHNGWIVGEKRAEPERHKGIVLYTVDGGDYWRYVYPMPSSDYAFTPFYDVHFVDASVGWIAAGNGYVLRWVEQIGRWEVKQAGSFPTHFRGVWAEDEQKAWTCGDGLGTVGRTEDGGANWDTREPFDKQYLFPDIGLQDCKRANAALWASDFETAFVALSEGKVGRTRNGGIIWEVLDVCGPQVWFRDVWSSGEKVWAVGTSGEIMHSANGGDSWREEHEMSPYHLNDVELTQSVGLFWGWAVGSMDTRDNSITILRRVAQHEPFFSYAASSEPSSVELSWHVDPSQPIQYFQLHRTFNNPHGEPFDFETAEPFDPGVGTYSCTDRHDYLSQWNYHYWLDVRYQDGSCECSGPYEVPGHGNSIPDFPHTPQQLQAVGAANSVHLIWDHVGLYTYHIYRSETESGSFRHIGETSDSFYEDYTVSEGITYFYKVRTELEGMTSEDSPVAAAGAGDIPRFDDDVQPDSTGIYYDVQKQVAYSGWLPVDNFDLGGYWVSLNQWEAPRILSSRASLQRLWYGHKWPEHLPTSTKLSYGVLAMSRLGAMGGEWQDRKLPVGACNAVRNEATLGNNARRFLKRGDRLDVLFSDSLDTTYRVYHTRSTDRGRFWTEPQPIGPGKFPALASRGENLYAVWTDGMGENLYFSRYHPASGWISPITLIEMGPCMTPPSFAVDNLPNYEGHVATQLDLGSNTFDVVYGIIHDLDANPQIETVVIDHYDCTESPPSRPPTASIAWTRLHNSLTIGVAYAAYKEPPEGPVQWDIYLWVSSGGSVWCRRVSEDKEVWDSRNPSLAASGDYVQGAWEQEDPDQSAEYMVECRWYSLGSDGLPDATLTDLWVLDGEGPGNSAEQPQVMGNSVAWVREWDDAQNNPRFEIAYSTFKIDTFTYLDGENFSQLEWAPSKYPQVWLEPSDLQGALSGVWTEGYSPHNWLRFEMNNLGHPVPTCIYNLGGEKVSSITLGREGCIWFGEQSYKRVDYSTRALQYSITGLEPAKSYSIGLGFYQDSDGIWEERVVVGGTDTLYIRIPPNQLVYQESASPRDGVGSIDITVERLDGDTAICSYVALFEGGSGIGGPQSADHLSLTGRFSLSQNYPNPFATSTSIKLKVKSEKSKVSLRVYDLSGRLVKTLLDGSQGVTGYESPVAVRWDGSDDQGRPVPNGVYFYKLEAGQVTATRKLIVLR